MDQCGVEDTVFFEVDITTFYNCTRILLQSLRTWTVTGRTTITRTEISFFMYNTHAWFRIDRNHQNILFVVVFIHFELRVYALERYFRTHFEILDHFVSKSNLTYSVIYYDIFSDLTLSVYFTEYYWIFKFTEFTEYLVVSTEYLNLDGHDVMILIPHPHDFIFCSQSSYG